MKKDFIRKFAVAFLAAFSAAPQLWALSKEVSKERDFVNYCTSSRYSGYDEIILTKSFSLNSDLTIKKNLKIKSKGNSTYTITVDSARSIIVNPGSKITLENIVFDCKGYTDRLQGLFALNPSSSTDENDIARLEMLSGAVIKNVYVTTHGAAEHAPIYVKKGARFIMNDGASILDCTNDSYHGHGGAIRCDSGNVVINGGTISGCRAKGSGGAVYLQGKRIEAEDHLGIAMRGDMVLYGGRIVGNTCGIGATAENECFGGGIYLGDTGPLLHVIGPAVVSNNTCRVVKSDGSERLVADDVSTYLLHDDYANRLKLSGDKSGLTMGNGWVGVRYPDKDKIEATGEDPQSKRFGGLWEYFTSTHEEVRQFFWNGDNRYRGWMKEADNALIWTRYNIYELPDDRLKVKEVLQAANKDYPVYIEFTDGFIMNKEAYGAEHIRVEDGCEVIFDLQGHSITCDLQVARGGTVTFRDSSTNRAGKVTGYRLVDSDVVKGTEAYKNAYRLEGGSYHTEPDPEWVPSNRVVIKNYCEVHPWMVARLAWETNLQSRVSDITLVSLDDVDNEIRDVTIDPQTGKLNIEEITFSSGDWVLNAAYSNKNWHVRVMAAPAAEINGSLEEVGPRCTFFDTGASESGVIDPDNVTLSNKEELTQRNTPVFYGREDSFVWNAKSHGLVKLIHMTYRTAGSTEETNAVEQAYFRFPEAAFTVANRQGGERLPITLVEELVSSLGYNRASGYTVDEVNSTLDAKEANGLMKWENLVTGTPADELLLCTAVQSGDGQALKIEFCNQTNVVSEGMGFDVRYALMKSVGADWERVSEVSMRPSFVLPLLNADVSANPSGFYRVATLLVSAENSVTNEISSTNIVGVLEIGGAVAQSLVSVPFVQLGRDPSIADNYNLGVTNFAYAPLLNAGDAIESADKENLYRKWEWNSATKKWEGAITVAKSGVYGAIEADGFTLSRTNAVWVSRSDVSKPLFVIGQYTASPVELTIKGASQNAKSYTLVPNFGISAFNVNDYEWGSNPVAGDEIRLLDNRTLTWNGEKWGRNEDGGWKSDDQIPAGAGFWYVRSAEGDFSLTLRSIELK